MSVGVLALDQGSHASRACIFDHRGALLASATVPVETRHPAPAHVEQDALELVQSLRAAARQAIAAAHRAEPRLRLEAAGLAVQRSTIVCCSRFSGAPLTPAISWLDRRHAAWLETLAPQAERIRELTGLPLSPHYGASKLRWCLEQLPQVARSASHGDLLAAPLASYLSATLTHCAQRGRDVRVDAANASRTLLYDSQRGDWSGELLDCFGIERDWLPRCAPTQDDWGILDLGDCQVPLRAVTGDQSAVPYAAGPPGTDTVYINLGTGAFIQRPLRARPAAPAPLLGSVLSSAPDAVLYSLEGTVNGAGSALAWYCEQQRCVESELWAALETLAHGSGRHGAALPVFVNSLGGLGSPWWRAGPQTRFLHRAGAAAGTHEHLLAGFAAVVESIAFMIAANAEWLVRKCGPLQGIELAGGMSQSAWLCGRLASLLEVSLSLAAPQASARGVARLAAPELAARWPPAPRRTWDPAPAPGLRERYGEFRAAIGP